MSKKITSISYLHKSTIDGNKTVYEREHIRAINGRFLLEISCNKRAHGRVQRWLSAYDFVIDSRVSSGDPVLTFRNGDKLRVYQGGDRTFMLTESRSLIELHDSYFPALRSPKSTTEDRYDDYIDYGSIIPPWPGCP